MAPLISSANLAARAQLALASSPIYALRQLRVVGDQLELRITGSVDSFYHKQLAQEAVRAVAGELNLINSVEVAHRPSLAS